MSDLVEAVGGSTINLPFAEVIPAMQRGVAECAITGTSAGNTARWWEVSDHLYTLPMGWSMTFFGANQRNWESSPRPEHSSKRSSLILRTACGRRPRRDIQDGINCNTAKAECKDGIPANPAMTLVDVSAEDRQQGRKILRERVLVEWARRCGAECAAQWNETVGRIAGVEVRAALRLNAPRSRRRSRHLALDGACRWGVADYRVGGDHL